jgi:hypothetical protein
MGNNFLHFYKNIVIFDINKLIVRNWNHVLWKCYQHLLMEVRIENFILIMEKKEENEFEKEKENW